MLKLTKKLLQKKTANNNKTDIIAKSYQNINKI